MSRKSKHTHSLLALAVHTGARTIRPLALSRRQPAHRQRHTAPPLLQPLRPLQPPRPRLRTKQHRSPVGQLSHLCRPNQQPHSLTCGMSRALSRLRNLTPMPLFKEVSSMPRRWTICRAWARVISLASQQLGTCQKTLPLCTPSVPSRNQ